MSFIEAAKGLFKGGVQTSEVSSHSREAQKRWENSLDTAVIRTKIVANAYRLHLPHEMQPDQFDFMRINSRLTYLIATKTDTPESKMDQKGLKLRQELLEMYNAQKYPLRVNVVPEGCTIEAMQAAYNDQIDLLASVAMKYYEGYKSIEEYDVPNFVGNTLLYVNMMHQLKKGTIRV